MHPHVANVFRYSVSVAVLGLVYGYSRWHKGMAFFAPMQARWREIVPLGLLVGFAAHQVLFIIGINHTAAGNAALIMATNPIWTALLSYLAGKEKLKGWAWAGSSLR